MVQNRTYLCMSQLPDTHTAPTEGVPLLEEEVVLENIHPSYLTWWKPLLATAFLALIGIPGMLAGNLGESLPIVALAALIGGYVYMSRKNSRYVVTNERVYKKYGWIRRTTTEARIEDIHSLTTDETILGRLLNEGVVQIDSTGASGLVGLPGTRNHEQFANIIRDQQQQ